MDRKPARHTVEGEPLLPVYSDYPAGTLVQNVTLSSQVLAEIITDVVLPVFDTTAIDGVRPLAGRQDPGSTVDDDHWTS